MFPIGRSRRNVLADSHREHLRLLRRDRFEHLPADELQGFARRRQV